ncbi:hypothetical protein L1987_31246 [Smallanthus sonchifolius]|uniref:Uncharacterized protein n=1 Tax=Smallanthus sonchifolius TaxID=185202 RepID=A0ACB9I7R2_9ASTR|nr:hypothetical protein L1987_31246 [Smallanthus sonchifolius]
MSVMISLKDCHPNPSSDLDHSPNTGILVSLAHNSSTITAFNLLKTLQKSSSDTSLTGTMRFQLPSDPGSSGYDGIPGVEFPYLPNGLSSVVGSCNGILCLYNQEISLCNFSIRRRLIVPRLRCLKPYVKVALGFGFDPVADDYKIVSVYPAGYELDGSNAYIFSLKTESWSAIPSPFTRFDHVKLQRACFFNGILHWVVVGYLTTEKLSFFILTFNLSSHVFGHILLPKTWTIRKITAIKGRLAVVSWGGGGTWIWVMKVYGKAESWCLRYVPETRGASNLIDVFQPIPNGNVFAYCRGSKVHNLKTGRCTQGMKFGPFSDVGMEMYVESLELVDKESATAFGKTVVSWK